MQAAAEDPPPAPPPYVQSVPTPEDPFPDEYLPPHATELGTTANQLRYLAAGGWTVGQSLGFAGQATFEAMTIPWVGIRTSLLVTLPLEPRSPQFVACRTGPSLHVLPYHRVDLGVFFEGGVALVDAALPTRAVMPVVAPGGTIDVALSPWIVVHAEGLVEVGIADRGGEATVYVSPVGVLGLGLTL